MTEGKALSRFGPDGSGGPSGRAQAASVPEATPCPAVPVSRRRRAEPVRVPFGTVSGVPLASRPRKTTVNLTFAEEDALEDLIRELRRRTGRSVSKDETWRALLVWGAREDNAADALADILDQSAVQP